MTVVTITLIRAEVQVAYPVEEHVNGFLPQLSGPDHSFGAALFPCHFDQTMTSEVKCFTKLRILTLLRNDETKSMIYHR